MKKFSTTILLAILVMLTIDLGAKEFNASEFVLENKKASLVQSDLNRYDFNVVSLKAEKIFNTGSNQIKINDFPIRPNYKVNLVLHRQNSAFTDDISIKVFKNGKKLTSRINKDTNIMVLSKVRLILMYICHTLVWD